MLATSPIAASDASAMNAQVLPTPPASLGATRPPVISDHLLRRRLLALAAGLALLLLGAGGLCLYLLHSATAALHIAHLDLLPPLRQLHALADALHMTPGEVLELATAMLLLALLMGMGASWRLVTRYACERRAGEARARQQAEDLALLVAVLDLVATAPCESTLYQGFTRRLVEAGRARLACVALLQGDELRIVERCGHASGDLPEREARLHVPGSLAGQALLADLRLGRAHRIGNDAAAMGTAFGWTAQAGLSAALLLPLRRGGQVVGTLALFRGDGGLYDERALPLLQRVAGELGQALGRLDQQAASRAKSEFLSRIGHELRTPLHAIVGLSQLLETQPAVAAPRRREWIAGISQAAWHLRALFEDVLDVARIEVGQLRLHLQRLEMSGLSSEVLRMVQAQADALGVELQFDLQAARHCFVLADSLRLRQVLLNLLGNAIKYNRRGGFVRLELQQAPGWLQLRVIDNGLGMDASQMAHLFEPFNRLGREGGGIEGAGVGMALVRQLVLLMQGDIAVDSHPGRGTTVHLRLPAGAPPPADAPGAEVRGCVLYIEDDRVNRLLVEQALAPWPGIELRMAGDGAEGLQMARALQPLRRPTLVLLDMHLPDMSGLALLRLLRAQAAGHAPPVVMLSADDGRDEIHQALQAGASDYWTKPLDLVRFGREVAALLLGQAASHASSPETP
jgi:signal transduction histidine kinase/CheY-like chemotaxis protein